MNFQLALYGHTVILSLLGLILLISITVLFYRYHLDRGGISPDLPKHTNILKYRVKHPKSSVLRDTTPIFSFGLLTSMGIVLIAFSWTKMDGVVFVPGPKFVLDEFIELTPRITNPPAASTPIPPPPVIEILPNEEILYEEKPTFIDQMMHEEAHLASTASPTIPPAAPSPPPMETQINDVVIFAEQMPSFPGCEEIHEEADRKACSEKRLLAFIYKNIRYPSIAQENGVEGTCLIRFVVDKDGSISQQQILRDHGAGLGEEALRVVNLMNDLPMYWAPGRQNGRTVRVQFILPITFKLR